MPPSPAPASSPHSAPRAQPTPALDVAAIFKAAAPSKVSRSPTQPPVPTVATKLLVPPPARHLIQRERLFDLLDTGVRDSLMLLSAPAGSGKTVLLSSWIAARELPGKPCWLSLDQEDNVPSRLLSDVLSALGGTDAIRRGQVGGALEEMLAPAAGVVERSLALLINVLAELPTPVVLVLDEVHELTSSAATTAIDYLVRHAPAQLRVVLAGRADPPLPIERMRASGALTELRIADLAFDRAETAELCRRLELAVSAEEIDSLWARTEGWPAAVRLAAVSMREHPEPARFLAEFAGTDRAVADYLVSEVLARLPEESREFMLRTCLVDAVSPELADALTEREGGTLPLVELERLGAPVQPTAEDGRSYRYHPLFGELLRAHLRHAHPHDVPSLHRRAARWYAAQGQTMPAIHHALAGADWQHAGSLIAEHWLELFLHGDSTAARGPRAQLPPRVVAADPRLAAAVAGSRLQDGDPQDAARYLTIARQADEAMQTGPERGETPTARREPLEAILATVALRHARLRVDAADAERFAHELSAVAHTCARQRTTLLRSFALCDLGATRLWSGEHIDAAVVHLNEALALATEHHHEQIALDCLAQLAVVHVLRGALTEAQELSSRAVELTEQRGWYEGPAAASAHLAAAACAHQRGESERAERLLVHAAAAADTAEPPVRLAVGLLQALTLAAAGQPSAARGALKLSSIRSELADGAPAPGFLRRALDDAEPRVLIAAGQCRGAREALAQAREQAPRSAALLVRQAYVELCAGEPGLAGKALARARAEQTPRAHPATLIEGWLLQALVDRAAGDSLAAARALDRALVLAEREPFRDAFLLNGPQARELLELQAQNGTAHPALLEVLLDGVGAGPTAGAALSEPLTEREQRILRYLPTMLTNAEIGAEVFVSLNTVKTHLRSIYRKLDVSGRADAVERARQFGLLPAGIKRPRIVHRV